MQIIILAAMSQNRVIGVNQQLPWHIPADLKRVKTLTLGKTIIMGRKTYQSIGRALPNRRNIVLSQNPHFQAPGCTCLPSLDAALKYCENEPEVFIFGGQSLYEQSLAIAQTMYLTIIDQPIEGDTFFPAWDPKEWQLLESSEHVHQGLSFRFLTLQRSK